MEMVKTVLFDVDGVLLSEERYFDASSLTVWEVFHSNHYLGLGPEKYKTEFSDEEIATIRATVFENDLVLNYFKIMWLECQLGYDLLNGQLSANPTLGTN